MSAAPAGDEADRLYELPLEQFTAARNELAKRLRAEDAAAAKRVARLRKPSRPAWAINRAVRARPKAARALIDAAGALAEAQEAVISGAGREALERAVAAEREAVDELMAVVREELAAAGSGGAAADRARDTLHAVAGDPELQAELEAGRVVADRRPVGFATAPSAPIPPAARTAAQPKRLAEARRRAARADRQLAAGKRNLAHARERLERARERLAEASEAAALAESEVAEIERDLKRRRREADDARAVLAELS